jgi:hypothetical protein
MKIYLGYGYVPWTTAVYWENSLRRHGEVIYTGTDKEYSRSGFQEIDILRCLSGARKDDVFIYVDSGHPYFPKNIEKLPLLTACYLIDVHVDLPIRIEMAKFFDIVFVAQKDYVEDFKARGIKNVWWIPFGCEPTTYQRLKLSFLYDMGCICHVSMDIFKRTQSYHMNDYRRFYSPSETSTMYSSAKIIFNCSATGDLNMRVFEALSCGRLLLTDSIANGLEELFQNRRHLVVFHDEKELLKLIDYYLSKDDERERIALCGSNLVTSQHTYDHRMKKVMNILKNTQKEKDYPVALWRNAPAATVSISRSRIFAHWQLLKNISKELPQAISARGYLCKSYYLLRTLLALFKKSLKNYRKKTQ